MNRRALRGTAVTLLCGLALLLGAGQAFAHSRLQSSDPADGSSVASAPSRVSLTFNEQMQPGFSTVTVLGPDNGRYETGEVTVAGGTVSIAVRPLGPTGRYEIGYRVISEDGHPVTGSIGFTLTTAGPAAPSSQPSVQPTSTPAPAAAPPTIAPPTIAPRTVAPAPAEGDAPVWPWIVGAVVLVGGGVLAALRLGRG